MLRNVNINVIKKAISKNKKTLSKYEDTTKNTEILKMGFLLMQYEFQRASHQVTVHEGAKIRYDNLQERYAKRVEKMESVFTKRKDQLKNDYRDMINGQKATLNGATGGSDAAFIAALTSIQIGGHRLSDYINCSGTSGLTGTDLVRKLTQLAQEASSVIDTLMRAAQDADEERLEIQEEQMIDPIREKDTEMQAKSTLEQTLTTVWQQRKDNAEQRLGQDIKGAFSGFTLGG